MLKKVLSVLLAAIFALSIVACSGQTAESSAETNAPATSEAPKETMAAANLETTKATEAESETEPVITTKDEIVVATTKEVSGIVKYLPGLGTQGSNITIQYNDSLVKRDAAGTIQPCLATSWETIDDLTWEFKLREGVKFHDGEPMNADAVVYTWGLLNEPDTVFTNAADFTDYVEKVEKVDDYTVRFITKTPYSGLLMKLTTFQCFPEQYITEKGLDYFLSNPIGNGPWKFVEWIKDVEMNFVANEEYWGGAPAIGKMKIVPISSEASRVAALEAGDVDIIPAVPSSEIGRLQEAGYTLYNDLTTRTCYVGFNVFKCEAFNDIRVREAFNRAINVDEIIEFVLEGYAIKTSDCTFNSTYTGFRTDLKRPDYDPEKAKELLKEAGYGDGLNVTMCYVPGSLMNDTDVVQVIVQQLSEIGVTVELSEIESGVKNEQLLDDTIADLHFESMGGPMADGDLMNSVAFDTNGRYSTWSDPELDELRAKANATIDLEEAAKLWGDLQEKMTNDMPGIALYQVCEVEATNPALKGWTPRADQLFDVYTCYFE